MAPDRNALSREQIMNKTQEEDEIEIEIETKEDIEIEMNDAGAGAVDVVVGMDMDSSISSRDGLLCTLLRLQVYCGPLFVLRKKLVRSYLIRSQNYLGITQTEYDGGFRRQGLLTDEEDGRVHTPEGLALRALDRRGVVYNMVLIHLTKTCRLRTGWGDFLRSSGVRQDADTHVGDVVEVWAFRSPATGLGLVLLHYTKEEEDAIIRASDSNQEAQCVEEEEDEDDDDKNCSPPLGQGQDGNCSPPLANEVVQAAAILISMTK